MQLNKIQMKLQINLATQLAKAGQQSGGFVYSVDPTGPAVAPRVALVTRAAVTEQHGQDRCIGIGRIRIRKYIIFPKKT